MAGFQLSGLASGFDWSSLIDQLMAVSRIPQDRLRTEKSTLTQKTAAVNELKTLLTDLQSSARKLGSSDLFVRRSASLASTTSAWSASASSGTPLGEYAVAVGKLAVAAKIDGSSDAGRGIATTADVSGTVISAMNLGQAVTAGEFTVNGTKISVAITDTLEEVFTRISAATGVTAAYDPALDKVTLGSGSAITLGSANDTSNFLQALKLYNNGGTSVASAASLGVVKLTGPIAQAGLRTAISAVDGNGAGTFTINGKEIAYNVNTDSLYNIIARINDSGAGVAASYDATRDGFVLTNKVTGDLGITVEEDAGGILAALGVNGGGATFAAGKNAEFTINGGSTIISTSNTFDASAHGIAGLSVTARTTGTETVRVSADSKDSRAQVEEFIAKFNAVQNSIAKNTRITTTGSKVTVATLAGDREINEIARSLRSTVFSPSAVDGTIKRLSDLGIDFKGIESSLSIKDSAALNAALVDKSADVGKFFGDAVGGLVKKLDSYLEKQVGVNGSLPSQVARLDSQSLDLDTQIAAMERRLETQRSRLEANFIEMERAQSIFQQQSQTLTNAFFKDSNG